MVRFLTVFKVDAKSFVSALETGYERRSRPGICLPQLLEEWLLPGGGRAAGCPGRWMGSCLCGLEFGLPVRLPNESRQFRREVGVEIQI